jgi:hypothetical protein
MITSDWLKFLIFPWLVEIDHYLYAVLFIRTKNTERIHSGTF